MTEKFETQSEELLKFQYVDRDNFYESFFKVYSSLDSLKRCKEYKDEAPLYIEIARDDSYINDGEGFGLTIEQTKILIKVLQKSVDFLENK